MSSNTKRIILLIVVAQLLLAVAILALPRAVRALPGDYYLRLQHNRLTSG